MSPYAIAFFVGLFGSVHCIGMCGPLALAVPSGDDKWWLLVTDKVLYNTGRVITYSFLGLIIGIIGRQLWLLGLQQGITLFSGALIIIAGLSRIFKIGITRNRYIATFLLPVNRLLSYALKHRSGHLVIGIINGLLPCGFVYLALAGALNTSSPLASAQYMFWFGAGTFPLMLAATISAGFAGPLLRKRINKAIPYFMVFLGFWFIMRGLHLNVPYLSPSKNLMENSSICQ